MVKLIADRSQIKITDEEGSYIPFPERASLTGWAQILIIGKTDTDLDEYVSAASSAIGHPLEVDAISSITAFGDSPDQRQNFDAIKRGFTSITLKPVARPSSLSLH